MKDFILLKRATLHMKEGYKFNMVRMIDLSVLCDRCYPTEQGYITDERGYKLNMVRMIDLSVLCDRLYPTEQGYITDERGSN